VTAVCHTGGGAFEAAMPAWRELLDLRPDARPFLRPAWVRAWWGVYGHGREARLIEVREGGRPVGLAFLQVTTTPLLGTRRLTFIGGTPGDTAIWLANPHGLGVAYANDVLTAPGRETQALDGLRAWLEAAAADWHCARFTSVPDGGVLGGLADAPPRQARVRTERDARHLVDTAAGWEEYYASRSKRQRRHLRYEPNSLATAAGAPLRDEWLRGAPAVVAMERFIDLHARRWAAERKPGLQSGEGSLYRALAAAHPDDLVVVSLRAGDRVLAMQWGFDDGRRYVPYNFAFDPDFSRQSPNNVLLGLVVRRCCEDGHVEIDLAGLASAHHWTDLVRGRTVLTLRATRPGARLHTAMLDAVEAAVAASQRTAAGRALRRRASAAVSRTRRRPGRQGAGAAIAVEAAPDSPLSGNPS